MPDTFEYSNNKTKCLPSKSLHSGEQNDKKTKQCQGELHAMKQQQGWRGHHLGDLSQDVASDQSPQEATE